MIEIRREQRYQAFAGLDQMHFQVPVIRKSGLWYARIRSSLRGVMPSIQTLATVHGRGRHDQRRIVQHKVAEHGVERGHIRIPIGGVDLHRLHDPVKVRQVREPGRIPRFKRARVREGCGW